MKIGLRQFGDETVHWFRQAAASGELTRSGLARELCERTDWRTQRGDLCLAQARTVVPQLAARLNIPLPAPVKSVPHPRHHPPCAPMAKRACALEALGVVSVEPVLGTQTPDCHPNRPQRHRRRHDQAGKGGRVITCHVSGWGNSRIMA